MGKKKRITFSERRDRFLRFHFKTPLRQVLSYLWDYKKVFIIVLIFGILQSILFLTFPLFLGPAVDVLVNPSIPLENILPIFFTIVTIQIFVGILFGIRIYINRWIGANVIYNLRNDLFRTIQMMNFEWLDKNKTGELISRTTSDVNLLKDFLGNNFQYFIRQCVTFSFSFVILFLINIKLAFFVLIISPVLFYVLLVFRKKLRPIFKQSREKYADLTHVIQESVQGIKVIKSFGRESHELEKFTKENNGYYEKSLGIIKLQAFFDPIIYLIDNIAFLIVLLLGGVFVLEGDMTFGDLFAFVMVLNFSVEPLYFISRFLGNLPQITETCERVVFILNSETKIREKTEPKEMPPIKGEIEFKNVSFKYDNESEYYVLKKESYPGTHIRFASLMT
jgi:ATP-binding cassette subfamily B protein